MIIQGRSGSGKTFSLRNVDPKDSYLVTANTKRMSFPGGDAKWQRYPSKDKDGKVKYVSRMKRIKSLEEMHKVIAQVNKAKWVKNLILDDFSHLLNERIMSSSFLAQNSGNQTFERWKVLARDVIQLFFDRDNLRRDLRIFIFSHVDKDDSGSTSFKTFGKLLKDQLDVISYVNMVLHTVVLHEHEDPKERYKFLVNTDGFLEAKSPYGMFQEQYIPNDLALVIEAMDKFEKQEAFPATDPA